MNPSVYVENDPARKRALHAHLTSLLGAWFGQPDSNAKYAAQSETLKGLVAETEGAKRGLLLLKTTSPVSAEVYWMGVEPEYHRSGIGKALIEAAAKDARDSGARYLFVATLHPDVPYEPYQRTRRFYEAMGFVYVLEEQFPADPENPSAFYLKLI